MIKLGLPGTGMASAASDPLWLYMLCGVSLVFSSLLTTLLQTLPVYASPEVTLERAVEGCGPLLSFTGS